MFPFWLMAGYLFVFGLTAQELVQWLSNLRKIPYVSSIVAKESN